MTMKISVTGLAELEATLQDFTEFGKRGMAMSVVRAGMRVVADQMRQDLKPQVNEVAAEVGYRFVRNAGTDVVAGKVGVGVGKVVHKTRPSRGRSGVGISARTFHWWVLGSFKSGQRLTTKRQSRGVLRPQQPDFANQSKLRAMKRAKSAMESAMKKTIERFASNNS